MKQEKQVFHEKSRRQTLDRLCSVSGLLLSLACCIALLRVELRMQEQQRVISHTTTVCDQMETEILRKIQRNYKQWGETIDRNRQDNASKLVFVSGRQEYWTTLVKRSLFALKGRGRGCVRFLAALWVRFSSSSVCGEERWRTKRLEVKTTFGRGVKGVWSFRQECDRSLTATVQTILKEVLTVQWSYFDLTLVDEKDKEPAKNSL